NQGEYGSRGLRIVTVWTPVFGVPKLGVIKGSIPCAFHQAYKTVLAFDCGFVTVSSEDQNLGVAGDGLRRGRARQSDLGIVVRDQVLLERGHCWVRRFGGLCLRGPRHA